MVFMDCTKKRVDVNPLLYRLDAWFDAIYERSLSGYIAVIAAFLSTAVILTGISAVLGMPGSLTEAFLGGSAGLLAFIGARGFIMHYYRTTDTDRLVLRERMGPTRSKLIGAIAGGWIVLLVVLAGNEVQHPAVGALTILVGLTLVTLVTKTPEEKTQEEYDETYWSSDPEFYEDEDEDDEDAYLYEEDEDYLEQDNR